MYDNDPITIEWFRIRYFRDIAGGYWPAYLGGANRGINSESWGVRDSLFGASSPSL